MMGSFSEAERIAIIGLIGSVSAAFLTLIGVIFTNWTTVYLTRINKGRKDLEEYRSSIILPSSQAVKVERVKSKFQIKPMWIPVVLAAGLFLTIILFLVSEHRRQQESEKHIFKSPDYYVEVGNQYADVGDFVQAESMYRLALEVDDNEAHTHDKLAEALREQGKLEQALGENFAAVAIDSSVGEYHFHTGLTLQRMGNRKNSNGVYIPTREHHLHGLSAPVSRSFSTTVTGVSTAL